ncbi:MAG: mannose-ethanolamine phosphotransferase gpi13 [Cirrosporium novae-zelandiae]|nr:MAG: mannose-ethanolamine phosphotransferase gpi13 [Cirrosporium novae-zelandiae]
MGEDGRLLDYRKIKAQYAEAKALKAQEKAVDGPGKETEEIEKLYKKRALQFNVSHGLLIAFLSCIFVIHVLGIFLFTKGFLLTRLVLDEKSKCDISPIQNVQVQGSSSEGCWHPKSFDKAVVILIDALRYDFTVPFHPANDDDKPHHFHNALPVLYETATQHPKNAFLLPFIADPPTTTLQRLKGLTTGTLPTFIDAGSNFAGNAIDEDNILAQLRSAGKNLVHLGDDTWHALFPGFFDANLTHAYDSFAVWDLHTLDNGVIEHLFPLLERENTSKWDVIFGHFLGVDHAGHRYGPDHPAMADKLQQMDGVIRQMIDALDDSTLLVVMGDHGMDAKGDHGGESDDEVQAALWMYSKKPIFGRTSTEYIEPPRTAKERPVPQIDLVPTLSLLLGIPIPYNNLGAPIEEAFIGARGNDWQNLVKVNRLAAAQINRYSHAYAGARGMDENSTFSMDLWEQVETAMKHEKDHGSFWSSPSHGSPEQYEAMRKYEREVLATCKRLWARFDVPSMIYGISLLSLGLLLLGVYAQGIYGDRVGLSSLGLIRATAGGCIGSLIGFALSSTLPIISLMDGCLLGLGVGGAIGVSSCAISLPGGFNVPFPSTIWGFLSFLFTISQSIGYASNSYTIWEDEIMFFFLATFGLAALISSLRQRELADRALGTYHSIIFLILTWVASGSRLCREEQMPFCKSTYYASATSSTSAPWQLLIPFVVALVLPSIIKSFYKGTKSYEGSSVFWIGFALRMGLLVSACFWVLDAADDGNWFPSLPAGSLKTVKVTMAQLVLGVAFAAGTSTYVWAKPCVNIETTTPKTVPQPSSTTKSLAPKPGQSVTILGYSNVHGSRYFLLISNFVLAIILVQKPMGGGAIGILAWQILSLCEIIDTNNLSQSAIGPIVLGLLGSFHFFKTGHQATLASIQWQSAFIPLKTIRYPWSPIPVLLNTFGAQILTAISVPLIVLWKQPPKKKGLLNDVAKAMATHILYHAVINLATTMWAGYLRRHLMLYRIFSPRFMEGALVLLVVDLFGIFVAVGGLRWNVLSVAEIFGWELA